MKTLEKYIKEELKYVPLTKFQEKQLLAAFEKYDKMDHEDLITEFLNNIQ